MPKSRGIVRLKNQVTDNAQGYCEYCRCPQQLCPAPFNVEHILPRASGGADELENLALSCGGCNGHKHTKIDAIDPVNRVRVPLFHPRRQQWHEHFEWSSDFTLVIGLTEAGRATVDALKMNRPGVVNLRSILRSSGLHPP